MSGAFRLQGWGLVAIAVLVVTAGGLAPAMAGPSVLQLSTDGESGSASTTAAGAGPAGDSTAGQAGKPQRWDGRESASVMPGGDPNESDLGLNASDAPGAANRSGHSISTADSEDRVVRTLEVTSRAAVNESALAALNATLLDDYGRLYRVEVASGWLDRLASLAWVERVHPPAPGEPGAISEGVDATTADQLHNLNYTGAGVSVGVLSCQGFNVSHPELEGHIADARSFNQSGLANNGVNAHGTAVAAVIADVAPDAELYLVNYGNLTDYARAIDWLEEQDVDVGAFSCGVALQPDTGDGIYAEILDEAAANGTAWFVAAGNSAEKHYETTFNDTDNDDFHNIDSDGFHDLEGDVELNVVQDRDDTPNVLETGDQFFAELKWGNWSETDVNATLVVYDVTDGEISKLSTQPQDGDDFPIDFLSYKVPENGTYAVAVYGPDLANGTTIEVDLFGSDAYVLNRSIAYGSIQAPSTGHRVSAIAAFVASTGERPTYSSAGPTNDFRLGINVSGPSHVGAGVYPPDFFPAGFTGTSAAAPHAGGVAALLLDVNPDLTVPEVYRAITSGANDIGTPGNDFLTGAGRLNATGAVYAAEPGIDAHATCTDVVDGRCVNDSETTTFEPGEQANSVLEIGPIDEPVDIRWEFVDPAGSVAQVESTTINSAGGESDGWLAWAWLDVNESTAAGNWEVVIYVDDERRTSKTFDVVQSTEGGPINASVDLPASAALNSTFEVTYTFENAGDADASSAGFQLDALPASLNVSGHSGDGTFASKRNVVFFVSGIQSGASKQFTLQFRVAEDASAGDATISGVVSLGDSQATVSTTVTLGASPLARFDTDGSGQIDFVEVLATIAAFNSGESIGGEPVTFRDVLDVIAAFNSGEAV